MNLGEGYGVVLHAVVYSGRVRFEIGGDEPGGGALHLRGATGDPEPDANEADEWQAEKKRCKELQMIAKHG
jgi:hypothetical protein